MKYIVMFLMSVVLLIGCQMGDTSDPAETTKPEPKEEETKEQDESIEEPEDQVNEDYTGTNSDEESENNEQVENREESDEETFSMSVEEARVITEKNLARSIKIMQKLQGENQDWFGTVEGTEEYQNRIEKTKPYLVDTISSHAIDEWATYYFEEFFIYNHYYSVLQPSSLNTRFELHESSKYHYKLSFIQLGDEAFSETLRYEVTFLKEAGDWKFSGYEVEEIKEPLNLTFEDLKNAFINNETLRRFEGTLVEEMEHEGESYLVIDYGDFERTINVNTGYDETYSLY